MGRIGIIISNAKYNVTVTINFLCTFRQGLSRICMIDAIILIINFMFKFNWLNYTLYLIY